MVLTEEWHRGRRGKKKRGRGMDRSMGQREWEADS